MRIIYTTLLGVFLIIGCLAGCGDSELDKVRRELKAANETIRNVRLENEKLLKEILERQVEIERLKTDDTEKTEKLKELKKCSLKLADGYGPGIWDFDEYMCPVFLRSVKSGTLVDIIDELNKGYKKQGLPTLFLERIDQGVAYVGVSDEEILTQQMGSHGATSYIKSVTYSLASVAGIDCVFFTFKWGDHAIPGEYCR